MNGSSLILLGHAVHVAIDETTMINELNTAEKAVARRIVQLETKDACDAAILSNDWLAVERVVRAEYEAKLHQFVDGSTSEVILHYFGAAPIPAAMLLGFLVGSWVQVVPHLRHHVRHDWPWPVRAAEDAPPKLRQTARPNGTPVLAEGDLIVRVATSMAVDAQSTRDVVPKPLAEFEIELEHFGLDALASAEEVDMVAREFRSLLDAIAESYPNAGAIHVFAAVPVGLAFRMGTLVSPTIHPAVQTYYFDRKARPQHIAAILLQTPREERAAATDADHEIARLMRTVWASELSRIVDYAKVTEQARIAKPMPWIDLVLPSSSTARIAYAGRWSELRPLGETPLANSMVNTTVCSVSADFDFLGESREWVFDDRLLAAIGNRLKSDEQRARAGRMLLLHEGVHLAAQTVTRHTSNQVGRFPKVLETIDYHADVWAMLSEYALAMHSNDPAALDVRRFILGVIATATETFWAFDAGPVPLKDIQVRRVNRYLIWYWQYLRIEHASDDDQVFAVLADQPVLELAGPRLRARGERVWFSLDARDVSSLELCVLHRGALRRYASGPAADLSLVLDGFRARDGELVKEGLRGIFAQVTSHD